MKSVVGPLVAAIVLAVAGGAFWLVGETETRIADMHKQLATLHYDEAESEGEAVEQSLGLERRVPRGRAAPPRPTCATRARPPATGARTTRRIAPRRDANGVVTETDPAILFLSANAGFRASQAATDRGDVVRRLDNVVKSYGEVLKTEAGGVRHRRGGVRDAGDGRGLQLRVRDPRARGDGPQPGAGGRRRTRRRGRR